MLQPYMILLLQRVISRVCLYVSYAIYGEQWTYIDGYVCVRLCKISSCCSVNWSPHDACIRLLMCTCVKMYVWGFTNVVAKSVTEQLQTRIYTHHGHEKIPENGERKTMTTTTRSLCSCIYEIFHVSCDSTDVCDLLMDAWMFRIFGRNFWNRRTSF